MFEITTIRKCIAASLAWPLFWVLVLDRWFLLSPFGVIIAFGIPVAGWVLWWKYYEGDGQKLQAEGRLVLGKSSEILHNLKKYISKKHISG